MSSTEKSVLIVGTAPRCGKTVVTTGLALALREEGFTVYPGKPLQFSEAVSATMTVDTAFMTHLTHAFNPIESVILPSAWECSPRYWQKLTEQVQQLPYPSLLEAPQQVSTPWRIHAKAIIDALDFAQQNQWAVLLVTQASAAFLAQTRQAMQFIQSRSVPCIGFIRVQTQANLPDLEATLPEAMLLSQQYHMPYLGDLPYSPSISVETLQQGNLLKLTQAHIDLLPLQRGLALHWGGHLPMQVPTSSSVLDTR